MSPILACAANSTGGVMGKMIDAQSIVVAGVATGQQGNEDEILRYVFWHSIALACLVGLLALLQAYVFPWMIPAMGGGISGGVERDRRQKLFATWAQAASAKKLLDFCVVAQEKDEEVFCPVFKQETQRQVAPTLEKTVTQLADANPAVAMRLTESVRQLNEGQQAFDTIPLFKFFQPFQDIWIKGEEFLQAALSTRPL